MLVPAHVTLIWTYRQGSSLGIGLILPRYLQVMGLREGDNQDSDLIAPLKVLRDLLRGHPVALMARSEVPLGCGLASSAMHVIGVTRSLVELGALEPDEALRLAYQSELEARTGIADVIVIWRAMDLGLRPPVLALRLRPWSDPAEAQVTFREVKPSGTLLINPMPSPTSVLLSPERLEALSSLGEELLRDATNAPLEEVLSLSLRFAEVAYPEGMSEYGQLLSEAQAMGLRVTVKKRTLLALGDEEALNELEELLRRRGKLSPTRFWVRMRR